MTKKKNLATYQSVVDKYARAYPSAEHSLFDSLHEAHRLDRERKELQRKTSVLSLIVSVVIASFATVFVSITLGIKLAEYRVARLSDRISVQYTADILDYIPHIALVLFVALVTIAPLTGFLTYRIMDRVKELVQGSSFATSSSQTYLNSEQEIMLHLKEFAKLAVALDTAISDAIKKTYGTTWVHTERGYQVTIPGEYGYNAWVPSNIQHVIENMSDKITVKDGDFEVSVPYKWHPDKGIILHYTPVAPVTSGATD